MDKRYELNCKTSYSAFESVITAERLCEAAEEKGLAGIAIVDTFNVAEWYGLRSIWEANRIRKIYGTEVYLKLNKIDSDLKLSITLLVKNQIGKNNLLRLLSIMGSDKSGYNYSSVEITEITKHREGLLIGLGCMSLITLRDIYSDKSTASDDVKRELEDLFDYYEVTPPKSGIKSSKKIEYYTDSCNWLIRHGKNTGRAVVAVSRAGYINNEDQEAYRILRYADSDKNARDYSYDAYLYSTEEMLDAFSFLGDVKAKEIVIDNTIVLADQINYDLPYYGLENKLLSKIPNGKASLLDFSMLRAQEIYGADLPEIIKNRIETEMSEIIKNNDESYFLLEKDMIQEADVDRLHTLRGLGANSFIAYLCGISNINPLIPHYRCSKGHYTDFDTAVYKVYEGYSLPEKNCPICGETLIKDGFGLPFEFLKGVTLNRNIDFDLIVPSSKINDYHNAISRINYVDKMVFACTSGEFYEDEIEIMIDSYASHTNKHYTDVAKKKIRRYLSGCKNGKEEFYPGKIIVFPKGYGPIENYFPVVTRNGVHISSVEWRRMDAGFLDIDIYSNNSLEMLRCLQEQSGMSMKRIPFSGISLNEILLKNPEGEFKFGGIFHGNDGLLIREMLQIKNKIYFDDFIRIMGMIHGVGTWDNNVKKLLENGIPIMDIISTREDCYEYFRRNGIDQETAIKLADYVRRGRHISDQYAEALEKYNISEWYVELINKARYVVPKGHAIADAQIKWQLLYYKHYYTDRFYRCFIDIQCDENLKSIIRSGDAKVVGQIKKHKETKKSYGKLYDPDLIVKKDKEIEQLETAHEMYTLGYKYV